MLKKDKKNEKRGKCPICSSKTTAKNPLVVYHIRYNPPLVILACKFCNFTEYALRNNYPLPRCAIQINKYKIESIPRAKKVILYHNKLGIKI